MPDHITYTWGLSASKAAAQCRDVEKKLEIAEIDLKSEQRRNSQLSDENRKLKQKSAKNFELLISALSELDKLAETGDTDRRRTELAKEIYEHIMG